MVLRFGYKYCIVYALHIYTLARIYVDVVVNYSLSTLFLVCTTRVVIVVMVVVVVVVVLTYLLTYLPTYLPIYLLIQVCINHYKGKRHVDLSRVLMFS